MTRICLQVRTLLVLALLSAGVSAQSVDSARDPAGAFPGEVRLLLPATIYAVPGVETNVYFDNVVLVVNPANVAFDVTCAKGAQQNERWTYTPQADEVDDYPFTLEVWDDTNAVIARAASTIRVVPARAGAGRTFSLLCIGDSLTHHNVYPRHLLDLCKAEGDPKITLIGSHSPGATGPTELRHEGYGGWTAQAFATRDTGVARTGDYHKRASPFMYADADGRLKLDFARYCAQLNGGAAPDFVTIFLGCNDTFSATDADIDARIDTMLTHYDALIQMIHGLSKDTRIGAVLLVPPAASQDAFGANCRCGQTRWQYKRNQHRVVERMTEHYGGRESENLWLIPANVNLDCVHNYPQNAAPWNARNTETANRLNNGVHPAGAGYRQIGDSIYCWIKSQIPETR